MAIALKAGQDVRIVSIDDNFSAVFGTVEEAQFFFENSLKVEEPLQVGDYVLLHIGFVMSKIDAEEAQASLESFRQMVALMPKQDILPC